MQETVRAVEALYSEEATVSELDLKLVDWDGAELKGVAVNCTRPLMAFTEMSDEGRWVCFGPQKVFQGNRLTLHRHLAAGT